jgi:prophage tail gpP-like protein
VDETTLSEDTGTQLTRSLVTELEAGAGSTTAARKAISRPDEHHQKEAALTHPALNHHKNTIVLAHNTKNSSSSCIESHKNLQQNHDDGLKLKTKPRRRRTSVQQQVQEEKDKLRS